MRDKKVIIILIKPIGKNIAKYFLMKLFYNRNYRKKPSLKRQRIYI